MREAARSRHAVDFSRAAPSPAEVRVVGRVPRIARLIAFAHHLDAQIRAGTYTGMADAARKLSLSRGRLTQILNLTLLCPEVQSEIVSMPPVTAGQRSIFAMNGSSCEGCNAVGLYLGGWMPSRPSSILRTRPIAAARPACYFT